MIQQYEHSKVGTKLFNFTGTVTKVLLKHKWLYYLLHFTWGIIMTLLGGLVAGILCFVNLFTKNMEFRSFHGMLEIRVGPDYWGGCSLGLVFLRDKKSVDSVSAHELGHSFQVWLGVFFPFVVAIPSAIRWWIRQLKKDTTGLKPYDSVWFEDAATVCGNYAVELAEEK